MGYRDNGGASVWRGSPLGRMIDVAPVVPVWKLTRSRPARRLYDALASVGLRVSVLDLFRREGPLRPPEPGSGPPSVTIETTQASERQDWWTISDPALDGDDFVLVALADGRPVGQALLSSAGPVYVTELDRTVDFEGGYIWGLSVDPDWRRRDIASALLEAALVRLDRLETPAANALVAPDNHPSRTLFRATGFSPDSRLVYVKAFGVEYHYSRSHAGEPSPERE